MTAVLKYDAACRAIAEAKNVDEVTDWIDKAAAVREYGRRIKNRQIEIDAIEIRVRAKQRRGQLLSEMRSDGRLRDGNGKQSLTNDGSPRVCLADLNITRNESSEEQKIAAIPADSFERLVARCRAYAEEHPEKHSFDVLGEGQEVDKKERRANRERVLAGIQMALPDKKYGVIYADPEWRFEPYSRESGMDRAPENHYPTSGTDAICARPVGDIAAADCALFLCATAPMLPDALRVMAAWGFAYKSQAIWRKDRIGTGYWFRNQHELLLVGTRGNIPGPAPGTQSPSIIDAPVSKHSEKPDAFYELIESYFPNLPKIELNARRARPGWDSWGNEAPANTDSERVTFDSIPIQLDPTALDTVIGKHGETSGEVHDAPPVTDLASGASAPPPRISGVAGLPAARGSGGMTEVIRNHTTPEGAALGKHTARLCDNAEPAARLKFPELPPRCNSCACREGPHVANGSPVTQMDFLKCIMEGFEFYCHEPARAGQICSGWAIFMLAKEDASFVKVPWEFSADPKIVVPRPDSSREDAIGR